MIKFTRAEFLGLLASAPGLCQRAEEWDFLADPSVFLDVHGMLVRYLNAQALPLIEERRTAIAQIRTLADIEKRKQRLRERMWGYLGGQPSGRR